MLASVRPLPGLWRVLPFATLGFPLARMGSSLRFRAGFHCSRSNVHGRPHHICISISNGNAHSRRERNHDIRWGVIGYARNVEA